MTRVAKPTPIRLSGGAGVGQTVEGRVIVSQQGFNARYDLDPETGRFARPGHDLEGRSFAGLIYCFNTPKGGIATSWAFLDLKQRGLAPIALVCRRMNPIVAQGAVLADLSIIDRLSPDPLQLLRSGSYIRLEPSAGLLTILDP